MPRSDLILFAQADTEGFGIHAEDRYGFGRPKDVGPMPKRTGPNLKVRDRDFGPVVTPD